MKNTERPTITGSDSPHVFDSVESHPAYAQIGASRINGKTRLYGSDFEHHNYVVIRVWKSKLHRGLSSDHHMASNRELIEVALSEAQWATFVSAMNIGHGVPCTLESFNYEDVPGIAPPEEDRHEQFERELKDTIKDGMAALDRLRFMINSTQIAAKTKKVLMDMLDTTERELAANVPFVAEQFGRHMEKTTEKAKIEINAYIQSAINRAGVQALSNEQPITLISNQPKGE